MRRALQLAALGLGRTSPNPAVGAVVVAQGTIVGEGWHRQAGAPHAEPLALAAAGERARGATLYVTLEPCCHTGRTPPCTEAIIAAGISRVVYACVDCDERCAGQGARRLTEAGIQVSCGPLTEEAQRLNEAYLKHKRTGLPFVTLKLACSLDGRTATRTGDSRWISGEDSRRRVHAMRDHSDAVMVGVGTVLADDPRLTTRLPDGGGKDPIRVVVDSLARTPATARVVAGGSAAPCLIAVTRAAPQERVRALQQAGAVVLVVGSEDANSGPNCPTACSGAERRARLLSGKRARPAGWPQVDLRALMVELGRRDVMSVLLEGGPTLAAAMVEADLVDKLVLFVAPRLIGDASAPGVLEGVGRATVADARRVTITRTEQVGEDLMIEAYLCSRD